MAAKFSRTALRLGNMLVDGPRSIHRSDAIGTTYVESSTAIHWNCPHFSQFRSCRIYCDACGDEDSGFLNPLVRFASWDRGNDIHNLKPSWPNVVIQLWQLPLDCPELQSEIEALQHRTDTARLVHFGLPVRRDFGENTRCDGGRISVETYAGWQSVKREVWIPADSNWAGTLDTIQSIVYAIGHTAVLSEWIERYDNSPEQLASGTAWEWDFQPHEIGKKQA